MNKLFTKIAAVVLGATMATGVGVAVASNSSKATPVHAASIPSNYTLLTTSNLSSLTTSDKVVIVATVSGNATGVTGYSSSDATVSTTVANWKEFAVTNVDTANNKYSLKDSSTSKWITLNASNKFTISSASQTSLNAHASGYFNYTDSNSDSRFLAKNGNYYRCYKGNSQSSYTYFYVYKVPAAKTLSSISVSGATTSFTVGDTFSFGGTVTATYSDSSTANVTSSTTFSGYNMSVAGNYTVTASYTEGGVTKTATYGITVSAATSPYITPAKASTSGYTGQNETLSFTYGNLTSTLGVSSSNTSVVTVGTPSASAGSGTVQINFVGAGSTTVKFKDGSTELASVSVSVTASSVTITGLPASKSISNGGTFNLGSLITVTATGSYSSDVTWESDNDSIVSVTSAGVITGESVGTTNVTVTSDDYPTATMTCSVTVANMISAVFGSGTSDGTTAETNSDNLINNYGYTVDSNIYFPSLTAVYPKSGNAVKLGGSSTKGSMTIGLVDGKVSSKNAYITKITVNAMAYGTDSTSITINGSSKTLTSSFADYEVDVTGTSTTSIAIEASAASKQRFRIQYINVFYANPVELSSVTTSGQNESFIAGNNWSYGGTLTAHYSDSSSATVTPTYFKYGASGINPTTAGTAITADTTLNHDTHNGKYIYVVYTEDEITKWASYQITVDYAAVTSVVIDAHAAEIGLNETYDYNLVGVTVNTSYADPGYEWVVSGNTVSDDYTFDGSGLKSKDTEGTITLRCQSTADNSKYDELVVTVTGDPTAAFTPASVSGYAGKSVDVEFTYGNIDNENLITIVSSNTSAVTVGEIIADNDEGLVTINLLAAGSSTLSIHYDGGSALDTVVVTVSNDSVVALNWTASNIKCYSGVVLPVSIEDTWMVNYEMASGDSDYITYSDGDYTVKLGGSTITLPHTWSAEDDGKTLCVEYLGFQSSTVTVDVTQKLRPIMADVPGEETTKTWNASSGALGSSMGSTTGVTDSGSLTFDDESTMSYTRTLEYLASGKSDYVAWSSPYIQFGSSNALEKLELSVANSNVVTQVQIYCWAKNGATDVTVKVGGNVFDESKAAPSAAGSLTFSGSASGNIVITMEKATKTAGCAQYIASVAITTVESSGETTDIANVAGHEAAQKAVVKFAKAFNAAMDTTSGCTANMSSAWTSAQSAWSTFNTDIGSLSSSEQDYAKNLIKYATAQWTKGTDSNYEYCLERCVATYEKCVTVHGQEAFMSSVRPVDSRAAVNPIAITTSENVNTIAIVAIVSIIGVSAIGGYFFLRKRKETN